MGKSSERSIKKAKLQESNLGSQARIQSVICITFNLLPVNLMVKFIKHVVPRAISQQPFSPRAWKQIEESDHKDIAYWSIAILQCRPHHAGVMLGMWEWRPKKWNKLDRHASTFSFWTGRNENLNYSLDTTTTTTCSSILSKYHKSLIRGVLLIIHQYNPHVGY